MEYELKAFEKMVISTLNPELIKKEGKDSRFINEQMSHAHTEIGTVKMKIIEASLDISNKKKLSYYIGLHQRSLVRIVDILFTYQQPKSVNSIQTVYKNSYITSQYVELYESTEALLTFVEREFHPYFEQDTPIPIAYRKLMAAEISANLKHLQKQLTRSSITAAFLKIILSPFANFLSATQSITYRELLFLKELQRKLFYTLAMEDEPSLGDCIKNIFLYLNYNGVQYFNFYIGELSSEAKQLKNMQEQIEYYLFKFKLINQQPMKPGFVSKPLLPSIKEQIGSWIAEELYFLEKMQSVLLQQPSIVGAIGSKVHTSLTVANLSLAVKLLVDEKVITNKNAAELMRMVARNFKTDKAEQISEDSLRNKSYNIEVATVDKMKDVIIGMMNRMKEY